MHNYLVYSALIFMERGKEGNFAVYIHLRSCKVQNYCKLSNIKSVIGDMIKLKTVYILMKDDISTKSVKTKYFKWQWNPLELSIHLLKLLCTLL